MGIIQRRHQGQGVLPYALLLLLIASVAIAAVTQLGGVSSTDAESAITEAGPEACDFAAGECACASQAAWDDAHQACLASTCGDAWAAFDACQQDADCIFGQTYDDLWNTYAACQNDCMSMTAGCAFDPAAES